MSYKILSCHLINIKYFIGLNFNIFSPFNCKHLQAMYLYYYYLAKNKVPFNISFFKIFGSYFVPVAKGKLMLYDYNQ